MPCFSSYEKSENIRMNPLFRQEKTSEHQGNKFQVSVLMKGRKMKGNKETFLNHDAKESCQDDSCIISSLEST